MTQSGPRFGPRDRLLTMVVIVASMAAALAIRILWPYDTVFVDGSIWFREMDSYYRMRLVDSLVHNFPFTTAFDPYSFFPYGIRSTFHPLTSWFIAVPALILGGGNPTPALIDTCGAYFPPILGALTVIPVYFLGRHLYGRVAGAASAILIAILPGEFLSRSLLGFTDHHVTEAFFSTAVLLFIMVGLREAARAGVTMRRPADLLLPAHRRTVIWASLAGVSLGFYLLAWRGSVLVLALLVVYVVLRGIIDYFRDGRDDDLVIVFFIAGAIATIMAIPTMAGHAMPTLYVLAMLSVIAAPLIVRLLTSLGRRFGWTPKVFLVILCGAVVVTVITLTIASPTLARYLRSAMSFMVPTGAHLTIMEMHPLFFPGGSFSLTIAWNNFVTALGGSLVGLVLLVRSSRRPRGNDILLFLVWSIVMLGAVLLQRRFGYYYAINAAVLCGFLVGWTFTLPSMQRQMEILRRRVTVPAKAKSKSAVRALRSQRNEKRMAAVSLVIVALLFVAVFGVPSVTMARNFATEPGLMTKGWYETATWLRENTPPPMDLEAYYALHDVPPRGESYHYPDTAYGVMAWWDYGHWITRIGQRMPVANPFQQGARIAGRFLSAQSEEDGVVLLEEWGCRYVAVDFRTSLRTFHGVVGWAGLEREDYFDVYSQRTPDGTWESIVLYYPEYYQAMLARLYNFRGEAHQPEEHVAVRYELGRSTGRTTKEIIDVRRFDVYDEALVFLATTSEDNWRLVSSNPLVSAVPLGPLQQFTLVYESKAQSFMQAQLLPEVRVFELTGAKQ